MTAWYACAVPVRSLLYISAVASVLAVVCMVAIDEPVARWIATRDTWPAMWNETIRALEYPLGISPYPRLGAYVLAGASLLALAIARLRSYAFAIVLVTLVHLLGRNLTMWMKLGFGRLRPNQWLADGGDVWFRDGGYSFPSGHVTLFASIVIPLAVVYPRTRPLLAIAAFAMIARVAVNAHFVSDVLGALASITAVTWLSVRLLRRVLPSQIQPASLR